MAMSPGAKLCKETLNSVGMFDWVKAEKGPGQWVTMRIKKPDSAKPLVVPHSICLDKDRLAEYMKGKSKAKKQFQKEFKKWFPKYTEDGDFTHESKEADHSENKYKTSLYIVDQADMTKEVTEKHLKEMPYWKTFTNELMKLAKIDHAELKDKKWKENCKDAGQAAMGIIVFKNKLCFVTLNYTKSTKVNYIFSHTVKDAKDALNCTTNNLNATQDGEVDLKYDDLVKALNITEI